MREKEGEKEREEEERGRGDGERVCSAQSLQTLTLVKYTIAYFTYTLRFGVNQLNQQLYPVEPDYN